jgi:hypothetical protein
MLRRGKTDQAQLELNKFVNKNLEEVYEEVNSLSNEFSSSANS